MKNKLVIVAHENLDHSKNNKRLLKELENENVTIHYIKYKSDHSIDVPLEQKLLQDHDDIVIQFPVQWFSTPSILKKWFDDVFSYGFAYGPQFVLKGKRVRFVGTFGGAIDKYGETAYNGISIEQVFKPLSATVNYVLMKYDGYFNLNGTMTINDDELNHKAIEYKNFILN